MRSGDGLVAAVYDAAGDRVHLVRSGDRVGEVDVVAVAEREVTLASGAERRTLSLKRPGGEP